VQQAAAEEAEHAAETAPQPAEQNETTAATGSQTRDQPTEKTTEYNEPSTEGAAEPGKQPSDKTTKHSERRPDRRDDDMKWSCRPITLTTEHRLAIQNRAGSTFHRGGGAMPAAWMGDADRAKGQHERDRDSLRVQLRGGLLCSPKSTITDQAVTDVRRGYPSLDGRGCHPKEECGRDSAGCPIALKFNTTGKRRTFHRRPPVPFWTAATGVRSRPLRSPTPEPANWRSYWLRSMGRAGACLIAPSRGRCCPMARSEE
jgi:hypothetical protein